MSSTSLPLALALVVGLSVPLAAQDRWLPQEPLPSADASFDVLFKKNTTHRYLAASSALPFRPDATGYDLVNAWWLAECSMLVYCDPAFSRRALNQARLPGFKSFSHPNGTQCFVAHDDRFAIVSFRGTEVDEIEDVITDLKFLPTPAQQGGLVHRGFKSALDGVWPAVAGFLKATLKRGQAVFFTGHSLGGALATLAASRYGASCGLYTFGSPRVGDSAFGATLKTTNYRFVHQNDGVTMLPVPFAEHSGLLKYIDGRGRIHSNAGLPLVAKDRLGGYVDDARRLRDLTMASPRRAVGAVWLDSLRDHAPLFYVTSLWNALAEAPIEGSYRLRSKTGKRISLEINRLGSGKFHVVRRVGAELPSEGTATLLSTRGQRPRLFLRFRPTAGVPLRGAGGRLDHALSGVSPSEGAPSAHDQPIRSVYRFYLDGRISGKTLVTRVEADRTSKPRETLERGRRRGKPKNPPR